MKANQVDTPGQADFCCDVRVDAAELVEGFKQLRRWFKQNRRVDALFSFEDGTLVIDVNPVLIKAQATGEWHGTARVPGKKLLWETRELSQSSSKQEPPIHIRVRGNYLWIGAFALPCKICPANIDLEQSEKT